jgi:hypothetical protein
MRAVSKDGLPKVRRWWLNFRTCKDITALDSSAFVLLKLCTRSKRDKRVKREASEAREVRMKKGEKNIENERKQGCFADLEVARDAHQHGAAREVTVDALAMVRDLRKLQTLHSTRP